MPQSKSAWTFAIDLRAFRNRAQCGVIRTGLQIYRHLCSGAFHWTSHTRTTTTTRGGYVTDVSTSSWETKDYTTWKFRIMKVDRWIDISPPPAATPDVVILNYELRYFSGDAA